ncbi:MAG: alpha/beta hydrolase [Alphaproteobacteria bacterium]|nr:alpha/beta hydrolase [Alphaproteobacteria bacterium]
MTKPLDREYLPSLSIPDAGAIFESWKARAAATRAKLPFKADIAYGPHSREVLDFYPAENARGCVVFIHGGYWVGFSKVETAWVAKGFVGQGLSVALINYPLCPEVTIASIRQSCARAFVHLWNKVLGEAERGAVVVTGHSAGGHLAAAHLVEDWAAHGLPANPLAGVISLSGVFDVTPLLQTSLQADLQLTAAQAAEVNLLEQRPKCSAPLVLAVGEKESAEFHRQSSDLAARWAGLAPQVLDVAGTNHFTIVDELAAPGGVLNRLAVGMARR